jgi:hypothetical protein
MKKDDTPSRPLQMPSFKHLRPAPLDSPIYRREYLVGAVVLGRKMAPPRRASAPETRALPEERS